MKQYLQLKKVKAEPMNRGEYNKYRGWKIPANEDPNDEGYLVELDVPNMANHPGHSGYITWFTKAVFEVAYIEWDGSMDYAHKLMVYHAKRFKKDSI